jgi:hypothetical protein
MVILLLLAFCQTEVVKILSELESDDFGASEIAGWSVTPSTELRVSDCGKQPGHRLLGGYRVFRGHDAFGGKNNRIKVTRTVANLPRHWSIKVSFKLFKIDSWTGPR